MILKETHIIPEGVERIRFYDYAFKVIKSIPSRKGVKKAIERGELRVNGVHTSTGEWVKPGQKIELFDLENKAPKTYNLKLDVVYEDDHIAVINKPAGINVSGNLFRTIMNCLQYNLKPSTDKDAMNWPKPVHRLDNQTSGLLLIAKTATARVELGRQFENKTIQKRYRAVVMGKPENSGTIEFPIDNHAAKTEYSVVNTVSSLRSEHLSLVDLKPITGRTHQLRIHMAKTGFPILGDKVYGAEGMVLKGKGMFLASVEVSFIHPFTKKQQSVSIDEPQKFSTFMDNEQRRWESYNS